jgi:hypothetical protein
VDPIEENATCRRDHTAAVLVELPDIDAHVDLLEVIGEGAAARTGSGGGGVRHRTGACRSRGSLVISDIDLLSLTRS